MFEFDTASASNGVKLALLEGQLLTREIDRATFVERGALAWAETLTRVADTAVPDADFKAASAVFS
jgi:alkylhydroperoxidase family enzyme